MILQKYIERSCLVSRPGGTWLAYRVAVLFYGEMVFNAGEDENMVARHHCCTAHRTHTACALGNVYGGR